MVQIFGGRGITKTGLGRFAEQVSWIWVFYYHSSSIQRFLRSTIGLFLSMRFLAVVSLQVTIANVDNRILAAEDVLSDLGVRQALRGMPRNARL
jgi:hypothetical protein